MKILYAIQGTGNGHLSRSLEIVPLLKKKADVDILVSGTQGDLKLPFPVKYQHKGLSFIFGKKGGVDMYKTFLKIKSKRLYNEIKSLPVHKYDLVINDFEPVSAWACHFSNKACVGLSHQAAVSSPSSPRPSHFDIIGQSVLKYYAPSTHHYGFHFESYDHNIYTPVIRSQIRELRSTNNGHYTVYLPSYDDEKLIKRLSHFKKVKWHIFSKHNKKKLEINNIIIRPIDNGAFVNSLASSEGVICGAGFETPAEALYLQKKLLVIPMKGQYEQHCNAASLNKLGVSVINRLKKKYFKEIDNWLANGKSPKVEYPDITEKILDELISKHAGLSTINDHVAQEKQY